MVKVKRTFLIPDATLEKLKKDSDILDKSLNEVLEIAINTFNAYTKIKREFRECPIKYGQSGKVEK